MKRRQASAFLRRGLRLALAGSALGCAASGVWLLYTPDLRPEGTLAGAALACAALLLFACLGALERHFGALGQLKEAVQAWSGTAPEALEKNLTALPGPAGELGAAFYGQMRRAEEKMAQLDETARETAGRETQQRIVHQVRDHLLPRVLDAYPSRENFELAGLVEDAKYPGSAYYDYFFIDPALLCLSVAQFSHDGVHDVLQMVMAQTMLRGRLWMGRSLTEAMSDVNARLYDYGSTSQPVTMLAATLNTWSGKMQLVDAGLPQPLLMRSGEGYERLEIPVSVPMGQTENVSYRATDLNLRVGNRLLLYTDGLGAMTNREGVPFREGELRKTLNRTRARKEDPVQTLRYLQEEAQAYCRSQSEVLGYSALLLEFCKTASHRHDHSVPASTDHAPELLAFLKERLEENGKQPRDYARLAVLTEELFALCCRKSEKGGRVKLECAVAPDAQSVTLRFFAALGGVDPLERATSGPDVQAAEYIARQSDYVRFQPGPPEDVITVVWFFAPPPEEK